MSYNYYKIDRNYLHFERVSNLIYLCSFFGGKKKHFSKINVLIFITLLQKFVKTDA